MFASTPRRFKSCFNEDFGAGSSGRGTAIERGEKGFEDDAGYSRGEKSDFGEIPVDDRDRDCQIGRLVVEAGAAQRTIVVVAWVIVMMKGHREGGKHQ
ncbi:MAG: hypothetical protein WB541_19890 [Syntrophobacteraceae bacterium]